MMEIITLENAVMIVTASPITMAGFQLGSYSQGTTDTKHLDEHRVVAVQWLDECLLILFTK